MPFPSKPKKFIKTKVIGPIQSAAPPAARPIDPPSAMPFFPQQAPSAFPTSPAAQVQPPAAMPIQPPAAMPIQPPAAAPLAQAPKTAFHAPGVRNTGPIAAPVAPPIASPVASPRLLGAVTSRTPAFIPVEQTLGEQKNALGSITSAEERSPASALAKPELSLESLAARQDSATGQLKKTSGVTAVYAGKPLPANEAVAAEMEKVHEVMQNYLELCDSTMRNWTPVSVIDIVHVLARSLGLDVVSVALIDPDNQKKFLPVVSRGYHTPPPADLTGIWEACIAQDAPTMNWPKLMNSTSNPETPLACWILHEGLHKFGYAPIHDGKAIHGFIVTGAYDREAISPLASTILEMLGGRMGLSLGIRRNRGDWPQSVLSTVKTLRDHFSMLLGVIEMLKEGGKLSQEELNSLAESGARSLSEGVGLLDKLAEEAAGSKAGK